MDTIIRNGTLIDGSGSERFEGDVGIEGDRIVAVGEVSGRAAEEIDARGQLVCPGFVDIHTHYDGQATWDSRLQPSSLHGVTTAVMGNCGVGFAPVRPGDRQALIELMEGVEDIPGSALNEGLQWDWESYPEYLDALERRPHDIDLASQLAHGPLRVFVMGQRGIDREPATEDDVARMTELVEQALRAGALGVSTSRTLAHRTVAGDFTPMFEAAERELIGIAEGMRRAGAGNLELISDFIELDTEFAMVRRVAAHAGRPVSISLIQNDVLPEGWKAQLAAISQANADGLDFTGQVFCRPVGLLLGLSASIQPFMSHPGYREVADLPLPERVAALRDPERKRRILSEEAVDPHLFIQFFGQRWDKMFPFGDDLNYAPARQTSYAEQAKASGGSAPERVYDALLQDDGKALLYFPLHNYIDFDLDNVRTMMEHPHTIFGLSDGGAHCASICDASVTTYLLTHWCREGAHGGAFDLEWMIRKQTRQTAETAGLLDRGLIAPGYRADLNVIDYDRLKLHTPRLVHDLPAGGARFAQGADGYTATLVGGQVTYRDGEATGALPGTLIRGARPAPR